MRVSLHSGNSALLPVLSALILCWVALCGPAGAQHPGSRAYDDFELNGFVRAEPLRVGRTEGTWRLHFEYPDLSRLPMRHRHLNWFAAPPGSSPSIEVVDYQWAIVGDDGRLVGPFAMDEEHDDVRRPAGLASVRISPIDVFRSVGLFRFEIDSVASAGRSERGRQLNERIVLRSADVSLSFQAQDERALPRPLREYDPYGAGILDQLVINPQQLDSAAVLIDPPADEDQRREWNEFLVEAAANGPILFSRLPRGGVYRIDRDFLRGQGIDTDSLFTERLRFFVGREEIPVHVPQGRTGRMRAETQFFFHVPEDESGLKPYLPLWIVMGERGEEARRLDVTRLPAGASAPLDAVGHVGRTIFEPVHYFDTMSMEGPNLRWATAMVSPGSFREYEFEVRGAREVDGRARIELWLSMLDRRMKAGYEIFINGHSVMSGELTQARVGKVAGDFSTDLLRDGMNTLGVYQPEVVNPSEYQDLVFIQADLDIPVALTGLESNNTARLELENPTSGTLTVTARGPQPSQGYLFDVTTPLEPRLFQLQVLRAAEGNAFQGVVEFSGIRPHIVYTEPGEALVPPRIERVQPPRSFLAEQPVDYLIITHPSLAEAVRPLLEYRSLTRRAEMVLVDDIYRAFAYGEKDAKAIRDMIHHTYLNRGGHRLREVLLVGEASESWWEHRMTRPAINRNLVPVFGWQDRDQRVRGDDGFAMFSGTGSIPDVEIGRISVNTPEEFEVVLRKTLEYEREAPAGDWRNRHVFIMDDEGEFIRVTREIVQKTFRGRHLPVLFPLQDFPYENYFRGFWRKRSVVMTDAIIGAFNDGAMTVTYLGHGGPNLWSGERIFHIRDIDSTSNEGRQPILLAGSCDTGWVDYPIAPVSTSLSEHFVKHEGGGAVAAFIPVGRTSSYEHNFLLTGFYDALMSKQHERLGTVCLLAKINYFLYRSNRLASEQYLLMGDTALRLIDRPELRDVTINPPSLMSITGGKLQLEGTVPRMDWGVGTLTLLSSDFERVFETRFRVRLGRLSETVEIPAYLAPDEYQAVITVYNEQQQVQYSAHRTLPVHQAAVRVEWERPPAEEEIARAGEPVLMNIRLVNDSGHDLENARLQIGDGMTGLILGEIPLSIPARSEIVRSFRNPVPPEIKSLVFRVVAPAEIPETAPVISETTVLLPAFSEFWRYISFPISTIEVMTLSGERGSDFRIPLFNLTDERLENLSARLYWRSRDGNIQLGPEVEVPSIEVGDRELVEFRSSRLFDRGRESFALELFQGTGDDALPLQVEVFNLQLGGGDSDLRIVPGSMFAEDDNPVAGTSVFVQVTARNNGLMPVRNVAAQLYIDRPWDSAAEAENVVPWERQPPVPVLYPGEEHTFRLRWDPPINDPKEVRLYAAITSDEVTRETGGGRNVASIPLRMLQPPNLMILRDEVVYTPAYCRPHVPVSVTLPIFNDSERDFAREFRLAVYSRNINGSRNRILNQRFPRLGAGERVTVQFDWMIEPGDYSLYINLNEDREYLEYNHDDNEMTITMPYVLTDTFFERPMVSWDFSDFPDYGSYKGVKLLPSRWLTLQQRPTALARNYGFHGEDVVRGRLGHDLEIDNLWGLRGTQILSVQSEIPEPVTFRIPLDPDAGTTLYDIYLDHIGRHRPDQNSGRFRYRIEGARDWTSETRNSVGLMYFGRHETRDNFLELELAGDGTGSMNHIYHVKAAPYMGIYESPIIAFEMPPRGRLITHELKPERTRIEYDVRYGHGTEAEIEWGDWLAAASGERVPGGDDGAEFFQWRARLYGSQNAAPSMRAVEIEVRPDNAQPMDEEKIAGAPGQRRLIGGLGDLSRSTPQP